MITVKRARRDIRIWGINN